MIKLAVIVIFVIQLLLLLIVKNECSIALRPKNRQHFAWSKSPPPKHPKSSSGAQFLPIAISPKISGTPKTRATIGADCPKNQPHLRP